MTDREELMEKIYALECDSCEECPLANLCEDYELFWGCGVWEDSMGEDLQRSFSYSQTLDVIRLRFTARNCQKIHNNFNIKTLTKGIDFPI